MLHIINQYKKLFISFMLNELNEWMSYDVEKAAESWNVLTIKEYKALLEKYKGDEEWLNKAVAESIDGQLYQDARVLKLIEKYSNLSDKITEEAIVEKKKVKIDVQNTINTDVFNRTLKEWFKGSDVMMLQEFLIYKWFLVPTYENNKWDTVSNADWKFWTWTKKALMKFQKSIWVKPDGVLTVSDNKTYKTLAAIKAFNTNNDYKWGYSNIYARKADLKEVKQTIENSWNRLDALQKLNENSDEFYKALEAYYDGWFRKDILSDMWWVLGWLEEVVWANNANDYFEKMKTYKDKIWDKEDKFNKQLSKILPERKDSNGNEYTERGYSLGGYAIRDIIIMTVFQDIPLFDVRLNFAKNLVSLGVPMDKAKVLKNWVDNGMEWEPDFSKENLDKISGTDVLSSLWKFKSTLTAYGFSNEQIDFALSWDLTKLSEKQKEVINTIINDRIVPDLETLRIGWFNFIERWFDKKDWKIKNKINQLTWNKYEIWSIKEIIWGVNNNTVSLQKVWKYYILSVDDLGFDSYKIFSKKPTKLDIQEWLKKYNEGKWKTERNIREDSSEKEIVQYYWYETDDNKLLVVNNNWNFQVLDNKKNISSDEIDSTKFDKSKYDNNLSIEEKLKLTWEIIDLLKIQNTEDWFYWTEWGLDKGIKEVDSRYEYTKGINNERKFLLKAIDILKTEDKELFKKFSMISTFWTVSDFMKAFPSNDLEVIWFLGDLQTADSVEKYVDILKKINTNKNLKDYFNIVFNAHKNNARMKAWKNYRISNIPREIGLKRVNTSFDRRFKYWETLPINITKKEALHKMQSETIEKWWKTPSLSVFWNLLKWMILKEWITDVSEKEFANAIKNTFKAISIEDYNTNVINTANNGNLSSDDITSLKDLVEKWDTHIFETTIEKKIKLYTDDWEEITYIKEYKIYIRPECNNLVVVPWSNNWKILKDWKVFNMDISNLNTKTVPITLMMLKWAVDAFTPDKVKKSWVTTRPDIETGGWKITVPDTLPDTPTF